MTDVRLRDMTEADLLLFFEHQRDPVAARMAAFTGKDPSDRAAYLAHWTRLLGDDTIWKRTIVCDGEVVGSVASYVLEGEREVTYGIAREHWGKGIATKALAAFLRERTTRPLFARAATDNLGSIRVLEKCGFTVCGHGRWFANARGEEIDEVVLRLDAEVAEPASAAGDEKRQMLRHTIATLAYRGGKALRGAPPSFAGFGTGDGSRTAVEIVAHLGDLLDWTLSMAKGEGKWRQAEPLPWDQEVARFHIALEGFDAHLASDAAMEAPAERLFQGPIADALTHVGQLAMMRRMAGAPIQGENYFAADMQVGRVGPEQSPPKFVF